MARDFSKVSDFFYRMKWAMPAFSRAFSLQRNGFLYTLSLAFEYLAYEMKAILRLNEKIRYAYVSLRKLMDDHDRGVAWRLC